MKLKVYLFGIAKEIFGNRSVEIVVDDITHLTVTELKSILEKQKPALKEIGTYLIAANNDYAVNGYVLRENDEIAVIPPVSGG